MATFSVGKSDNRRPVEGNHCRGDHCRPLGRHDTKVAVASTAADAALLRQLIARGLQTRAEENYERVTTPNPESRQYRSRVSDEKVVTPNPLRNSTDLVLVVRDTISDERTITPRPRRSEPRIVEDKVALPQAGIPVQEDKVSVIESLKAGIGIVGGGYLVYKIVRALVVGAVATPVVGAASLALP